MNSNQRNQGNKQSDKDSNQKSVSSPHPGTTADKGNLKPESQQSQQSGGKGGAQQQGGQQGGQKSTDRTGSQTGAGQQQGSPGQRQSNDSAGGMPRGPGGSRQAADQDMDDNTGLSNKAKRQSSELDEGSRQSKQSNVGRRDDGTPD